MIECNNVRGKEKNRSMMYENYDKMGGGKRLKTGESLNPWRSISNVYLLWLVEKTTLRRKIE